MFIAEELDRYFYWQEERESIRRKKENGLPAPGLMILFYKSLNSVKLYREEDRTIGGLKKHIREPLRDDPRVFMAVIIFRWFNLIETGRTLIENDLLFNWDRKKAVELIKQQPRWITWFLYY